MWEPGHPPEARSTEDNDCNGNNKNTEDNDCNGNKKNTEDNDCNGNNKNTENTGNTANTGKTGEDKELPDSEYDPVCKICLVESIKIVFVPCGHFLSCSSCAPSLNNCPVCRTDIRGMVRAYLV